MALDGLKIDGAGGVVTESGLASSLGLSERAIADLENEIPNILLLDGDESSSLRFQLAHIIVTHLTHEERMCALHAIYQADVAPCSGDKLCRLEKKVMKKLQAVPELKRLWHLL
jgi:hypothetical protein